MATFRERKAKDGTPRYTVRIRIQGSPEQSATFRRLTDARKWARQIESALVEGRHITSSEARKRTVGELIDRYVAQVLPDKASADSVRHTTAGQFNFWKAEIGDKRLSEITPSVVGECRDMLRRTKDRYGRPRGPATCNRYLAALSVCFSQAVREWGWLESNPVKKVRRLREPRGRVRYLDEGERDRLLQACTDSKNPDLYDVVLVGLCTGMRQGEILGLRWRNVDLERGIASLLDTKNKESRAVPLVGPALDALKARAKIRRIDTDLVFPSPNLHGENAKPVSLKRPWKNALEAAGVSDFRFHDLRHSCASYLAMNGATTHEIAEVLGHKTLAMVKRYTHLSQSHTSAVLGSMVENVFGDSGKEGVRRGDQ